MTLQTEANQRALERFAALTPEQRKTLLETTYAKQRADHASYGEQPGTRWDDKVILEALTMEELEYAKPKQKERTEKEKEEIFAKLVKGQRENLQNLVDNPEEEVTYSCFVVDGDEIYQQTTKGFVNRAGMTFKELNVGGKKVKPLEGQELDSRDGKLPFLLLADQPEDYVSFKSLIDDTEALIKEYVDIDDNFRKITALYVALTWVQDKLRTTPYWRVKGDFGRGKTRAWEVAKSVCCNPLSASGALTSAPIFRIIEKWRLLTLAIDEADIKQSDASNDIVKIINTGFEAGGGVMRCDQNNPNDIQFFRTFCPKMFSMRTPFQDNATESRCLSTNMEATRRKDIPIELNPKFDAKARALRNRFLDYRLKKWATFTPLDEPKFPEGLEGRLKQIAIAFYPLLETKEDEKWFNDWLTNYQHKIRQERATSYSGMVLQTIRDCCEQYKDADLGADYRFVTNNTVALTLKDSAQAIAKETKALGFKTQVQKWKNINGIQRLQRQLVIDAEKWLEITERYAPEGALAERPELLMSDDEKRENQAKLAGMTVSIQDKDQNKLVSEVSEISHVSGTESVSGSALYSHS